MNHLLTEISKDLQPVLLPRLPELLFMIALFGIALTLMLVAEARRK